MSVGQARSRRAVRSALRWNEAVRVRRLYKVNDDAAIEEDSRHAYSQLSRSARR